MLKNILILFFFFFILSCSKSKESDDKELPVIQITSPANNQVFAGEQVIALTGTISDNNKLIELHVHISNNTTGQLLIDIHRYPSAATYVLNETFQAQAGISYKIQVIAADKAANQQMQSVLIAVN